MPLIGSIFITFDNKLSYKSHQLPICFFFFLGAYAYS